MSLITKAIASMKKVLAFDRQLAARDTAAPSSSRHAQLACLEEVVAARSFLQMLLAATPRRGRDQHRDALGVALHAVTARCEQSIAALRATPMQQQRESSVTSHRFAPSPFQPFASTPSRTPPSAGGAVSREVALRDLQAMGFDTGAPCPSFADIIGQDAAKDALYEASVLSSLLPPGTFSKNRRPASAILLHGPPGTGKTSLAKAAADALRTSCGTCTFLVVTPSFCLRCERHHNSTTAESRCSARFLLTHPRSPSPMRSKFQGESEKFVRKLFSLAAAAAPSLVFFDEIDALGLSREGNSAMEGGGGRRLMLSELLVAMEDRQTSPAHETIVIAATNKPSDVDEALLRRFDRHVSVGLPHWQDRLAMLQSQLQGVENDIVESQLRLVADQTEGWSGSDLAALTRTAVMYPVHDLAAEVAAGHHQGSSAPCRAVHISDFGHAFEGMGTAGLALVTA